MARKALATLAAEGKKKAGNVAARLQIRCSRLLAVIAVTGAVLLVLAGLLDAKSVGLPNNGLRWIYWSGSVAVGMFIWSVLTDLLHTYIELRFFLRVVMLPSTQLLVKTWLNSVADYVAFVILFREATVDGVIPASRSNRTEAERWVERLLLCWLLFMCVSVAVALACNVLVAALYGENSRAKITAALQHEYVLYRLVRERMRADDESLEPQYRPLERTSRQSFFSYHSHHRNSHQQQSQHGGKPSLSPFARHQQLRRWETLRASGKTPVRDGKPHRQPAAQGITQDVVTPLQPPTKSHMFANGEALDESRGVKMVAFSASATPEADDDGDGSRHQPVKGARGSTDAWRRWVPSVHISLGPTRMFGLRNINRQHRSPAGLRASAGVTGSTGCLDQLDTAAVTTAGLAGASSALWTPAGRGAAPAAAASSNTPGGKATPGPDEPPASHRRSYSAQDVSTPTAIEAASVTAASQPRAAERFMLLTGSERAGDADTALSTAEPGGRNVLSEEDCALPDNPIGVAGASKAQTGPEAVSRMTTDVDIATDSKAQQGADGGAVRGDGNDTSDDQAGGPSDRRKEHSGDGRGGQRGLLRGQSQLTERSTPAESSGGGSMRSRRSSMSSTSLQHTFDSISDTDLVHVRRTLLAALEAYEWLRERQRNAQGADPGTCGIGSSGGKGRGGKGTAFTSAARIGADEGLSNRHSVKRRELHAMGGWGYREIVNPRALLDELLEIHGSLTDEEISALAHLYAEAVWECVAPDGDVMRPEHLLHLFTRERDRQTAWNTLAGNKGGMLNFDDVVSAVASFLQQERATALTVNAVRRLTRSLQCCLIGIINGIFLMVVYLIILDVARLFNAGGGSSKNTIDIFTAYVVVVSLIFSEQIRNVLTACVLILVQKAFDVGEELVIEEAPNWRIMGIVQDFNLFYLRVKKSTDGELVTLPLGRLTTSRFTNLSRSDWKIEQNYFAVDLSTPPTVLTAITDAALAAIRASPNEYDVGYGFLAVFHGIERPNKVIIRTFHRYKFNLSAAHKRIANARHGIMLAIRQTLDKFGVEFTELRMHTNMGYPMPYPMGASAAADAAAAAAAAGGAAAATASTAAAAASAAMAYGPTPAVSIPGAYQGYGMAGMGMGMGMGMGFGMGGALAGPAAMPDAAAPAALFGSLPSPVLGGHSGGAVAGGGGWGHSLGK